MSFAHRLPPALQHRDFAVFWLGSLFSWTGTQFTTVAMAWQMYELTNSAFEVGLLGLARAVPQIALGLVGGVLVDVMDRRRLLIVLQLVQFATSLVLAGLSLAGLVTPLALYGAALLLALVSAVEQPARGAALPNLVPLRLLPSASALAMAERHTASVVGPSLAGITLAFAGPGWCYAFDAASWLVMLAALAVVSTPLQAAGTRAGWSLATVLAGARFVVTQPVIFWFMVLDFGATLFGSPNALLPVFARDLFGVGPTGLGLLYTAIAGGNLLAALFLSTGGGTAAAGKWVLGGVALYGAAIVGFALCHTYWIAVVMLGLSGLGNGVSAVLRSTSNQLLTPDHLRGRVGAVNNAFVNGGPQLGQFESGLMAGLFGAEMSAFTGGAGALLLALGVATVPAVREFTLRGRTETVRV